MASLSPQMTIKEMKVEGLCIHGEKNEEVIMTKVYDVLKKVGLLPDHANRYPHEFSGGQCRCRTFPFRCNKSAGTALLCGEVGADDIVYRSRYVGGKVFLRQDRGYVFRAYGGDGGGRRAFRESAPRQAQALRDLLRLYPPRKIQGRRIFNGGTVYGAVLFCMSSWR